VQTQLTGTGWVKHFLENFAGKPGSITSAGNESSQGVSAANTVIPFHFPTTTLAYFQFVFAAITPLLFLGSVLGRIKFSAWCLLVPLWSTFVYGIDAFLLWGGGYFAQEGSLDFSGGYVIHLAAGVSGFVAAAMVGPRLQEDRDFAPPNNLLLVGVGAGMLWLGWNGFNGGDPYLANGDAAAAVLNTNVATGVALLVWMIMDMTLGKSKKPTFLGVVNGMIVGLVAITPAAGYVSGAGAIAIGAIASFIVWFAFNKLSQVWIFAKVDDALGVVYTHGVAGLTGGMLVGLFADPAAYSTAAGAFHHHPIQLWYQFGSALTIIVWDAVVTFILLKLISFVVPLRAPEADLVLGDLAFHGETLYDTDVAKDDIPLSHQPAHVAGGAYIEPIGGV
jgi:Amt family ammonium transporter